MLNIFFGILKTFLKFLKFPFFLMLGFAVVFAVLMLVQVVIQHRHGARLSRGEHKPVKKPSFVRKIFIQLPRQFVEDIYSREADFFPYQGLIIYTGRQGSGKTSTMIHDTMLIQKEYPRCRCLTNLAYTHEDDRLAHWRKLVHYKNGIYGVVAVIDEMQNWFNSNQSKNFPPEMLQVITQNRKNRRVIFGTAQNFYLLSKAIRSQTTEVRECNTFFGCLTVVRRKEPVLDASGDVVEWKKKGMYFYIHDRELRESYDTYKVIASLVDAGFKDDNARVG